MQVKEILEEKPSFSHLKVYFKLFLVTTPPPIRAILREKQVSVLLSFPLALMNYVFVLLQHFIHTWVDAQLFFFFLEIF